MKWIFGALLIIVPLLLMDQCQKICGGQPSTCKALQCNRTFKVDCNSCGNPNTSVRLLSISSTEYQIQVPRDKDYRPNKPLCFMNATCSSLTCCRSSTDCNNAALQSYPKDIICDRLICLDPETLCKNATYNTSCSDGNYDIIFVTNQSKTCSKCGDPYVKPAMTIDSIQLNLFSGPSNHSSIRDTMKNVMSEINKLLGNETSASISSGHVNGIFLKSKTYAELNTMSFMYSASTQFGINQDEAQLSSFKRSFSVPMDAFKKAYNLTNGTAPVAVFRFPKFQQDEKNSTLLDNEVFSIDFGLEIKDFASTVDLTFRNVDEKAGTPTCHSWDGEGSKPNWTTDGCNTTFIDNTVTCSCNHLTFFAVLMSDPKQGISTLDLTPLTYITSIGCGLSIFFLGVALFRHFLLRRARASHSVHILINLILAIFLLNLTFLTNEYVANAGNAIGCKLMAALMHYFMLSSFQWFCIEALHLCLQITKRTANIPRYLIKLQVGGWAPPAIMVACIFAVGKYDLLHIHTDTQKTVNMCWIMDSNVHYIVNIGYYTCVFLFTSLTFVIVLYWLFILRSKHANIPTFADKTRPSDAMTIWGLFCVLGLGWGFALFAYGPLRVPALYIFTGLNSFQGFFLFIYYYVTSKPAADKETETDNTMVLENPYKNSKQPERVSGRRLRCYLPSNGQ